MAELIPIEYRIRVATRNRLRRWALAGVLALVLASVGVGFSAIKEWHSASDLATLEKSYHDRSSLIVQSEGLKAHREVIADRMHKIEQLMDDRVLLALLQQIAGGFSSNDCLEYIHIDARGVKHQDVKDGAPVDPVDHYIVHINGMTTSTSTLAALMTRLSAPANMPVSIMLDKSSRENVLDGQVVQFQITCEKAKEPTNTAG